LEHGDLLFARQSLVASGAGKIAIFKGKSPTVCESHLIRCRINKEKADPAFIYYLFKSPLGKNKIYSIVEQTAAAGIRGSDLKRLKLSIPSPSEQKEIAEILSSLDDKIELNNKINKNLEQLAQTIFKRWFVDFEFPCLPENYSPAHSVNAGEFSGAGEPAVKTADFKSLMTYRRVGGLPVPDGESWFVYVLLCKPSGGEKTTGEHSFYKGITKDLYRRFYEHYTGNGAEWTKTHKPVKVIHWEKFSTQEEAAEREKELKSGYGRTWLQRQYSKVNNSLPAPECKLRMAGKMVESDLGLIPEGWHTAILDELFVAKGGGTPRTKIPEFWNGSIHWSSPKDLAKLRFPVLLDTEKKITEKGLAKISSGLHPSGTLLMSSRAPIGYLAITEIETAINQGYISINPKGHCSNLFMLYWLKQNMETVKSMANGSTFLEINKASFRKIKIVVPPKSIHDKFQQLSSILFKHLVDNEKESLNLIKLRDTLLPKLITGKLEISQTE
jgi:type I restriction enzyme S subunit